MSLTPFPETMHQNTPVFIAKSSSALSPSPLSFPVGASFLAITTNYTALGSPFVVPSAAAKAGVEALTKWEKQLL